MKIKWICLLFWILVKLCSPDTSVQAETKFYYGTKLKIPVLETRLASNTETTNFGISIFSNKISPAIPVSVKFGNLSTSGIISKMNRPSISGPGSPFSSGITSVNGITASLPGITSYSKPFSSFIQGGYSNKKSAVSNLFVNCWYSPEENFLTASAFSKIKLLNNKIILKNAFAAGSFFYSENKTSSWTVEYPYYQKGEHYVSSISQSIEFWKLYFQFQLFYFESPFGKLETTYKSDFKYTGSHFIFSLSGTYNPNVYVLTSSDKKIYEGYQLKVNIQYKDTIFIKRPLFYKFGLNTFINGSDTSTEKKLKFSLGNQINYGIATVSIVSNIENNLTEESPTSITWQIENFSFNISSNFKLNNIAFTYTFNPSFSPIANFTSLSSKYSNKFSVSYNKHPNILGSLNYTIHKTDDVISSKKLTTSINSDIKFSLITCSIKIGLDVDI